MLTRRVSGSGDLLHARSRPHEAELLIEYPPPRTPNLPAVGGKFGVRGGGYSMSNSASWGLDRAWSKSPEPETRLVNMNHLGRALTEYDDPPVKMLFVYNCNPAATVPDQQRIIRGLEREDL